MCGIIGVVRRRATRVPPATPVLVAALDEVLRGLSPWADGSGADPTDLAQLASAIEHVDVELRGVPGVRALLGDRAAALALADRTERLAGLLARAEDALDAGRVRHEGGALEAVNAALLRAKDATWAVQHDRLRTARAVGELAGADASASAIEAFTSVQVALSALDRLEVRGRDSAGLHLLVRGHDLDLTEPSVVRLLEQRARDPLFEHRAVRTPDDVLSFVYKAAAEIGELGDNTRRLRTALHGDELLHLALGSETADVVVLGLSRCA
jgi:glucosamine--fructose-6-phosphate aminotransferase (isomerizing)